MENKYAVIRLHKEQNGWFSWEASTTNADHDIQSDTPLPTERRALNAAMNECKNQGWIVQGYNVHYFTP